MDLRASPAAGGTAAAEVAATPRAEAAPAAQATADATALRLDTALALLRQAGQAEPSAEPGSPAYLQALLDQLVDLSSRDALTGLANRRHFGDQLAREANRAGDTGRPLSLCVLDIDHFKAINDRSGHLAGDSALRAVAEEVRRVAGPLELPCRLGGDEFALVLRVSDDGELANRALGLMAAIRSLRLPSLREHRLSVSVGGAFCVDPGGWSSWYSQADAALYEAKRKGGDHWRLSA